MRTKSDSISLSDLKPRFVSIQDAAAYTSESTWVIKDLLRRGELKAKKAGRRTIVEFAGVKARAENLPDAKFAPPRRLLLTGEK